MKLKITSIIVAVFLTISGESYSQQKFFPTKGWKTSTPENQGMDGSVFAELDEKIKAGDYGYTDDVLIIRNGCIVFEKSYSNDYEKIMADKDKSDHIYNYELPKYHPFYKGTKLHSLQSVTKSVTSVLIGIAFKQGKITDVNKKIVDYFDDYNIKNNDKLKKSITLEDVLTMRVGNKWNEWVSLEDPNNSCTLLEASEDWVNFVINLPMAVKPGTQFVYNSGGSVLLSAIIKKTTGMYIDEYAGKFLFKPLGISDYYWKKTPTKLPDTEGGLYLESRSLAKIGYLYLNEGNWDGKQILSKDYVKTSTSPHVKEAIIRANANVLAYGYQWWLTPNKQTNSFIYTCLGYGDNYLFVVPELNIIAVFNGWNVVGRKRIPVGVIYDYVLNAVKK